MLNKLSLLIVDFYILMFVQTLRARMTLAGFMPAIDCERVQIKSAKRKGKKEAMFYRQ